MSNYKQLTVADRTFIETGISKGDSFVKIGKAIGKNRSSVTREVVKNRKHIEAMHHFSNDCIHAPECTVTHLCGNENCPFPCKWCRKEAELGKCCLRCSQYSSTKCSFLLNPPYVCNNCQQKDRCTKDKYFYSAKEAEGMVSRRRSMSRLGPQVSAEKLAKIDKLLFKLMIRQGQSVSHILSEHAKEIGVTERTIYNYIDKCYLQTRNINLRRKPGMKPRSKKVEKEKRRDRSYKQGRSYADFNDYVISNTDEYVCEMDTVIGKQSESKRILTLLFRRNSILMIFLLPNGKSTSVCNVFNWLESKLGLATFQRLFPTILTDNGSEFQQVEGIEISPENEYRTNVYYCDPMASWQKGSIERAHEFIRYVLPKGSSFARLEQIDFTLLMNHINSYQRKSLDYKCPYDMVDANDEDMNRLMDLLRMRRIPPDEVNLTPSLLKRT